MLKVVKASALGLLLAGSVTLAVAGEAGHATEHKNIVGLFLGVTDNHGVTDTTFGVEYEYKISTQFGVGAAYETSPDAHHGEGVDVITASAFWHPHAGWRLGLGAGQESVAGHSQSLTRISAAYDFHVAGFGVAPGVAVDQIDGSSVTVYGVAISKGF